MSKFPPPSKRTLSLRGNLTQQVRPTLHARETIDTIVKKTRSPFIEERPPAKQEVEELEATMRALEEKLYERERDVSFKEARLAEKERELWEWEALLKAKEKLLDVQLNQANSTSKGSFSEEEVKALQALKAELAEQEQHIREARKLLQEREAFLEESEKMLMDKFLEHQIRESELEQREEMLRIAEKKLHSLS